MEKPTELLFSVIQNMKIIFTEIFTLTFTENGVSALNFKRVCQISWIVCHRGSRGSCATVPLWVFCESIFFSQMYLVSPKFVHMGISWVQNFFSLVFRGSKNCPSKQFVDPKFFSLGYFISLKFYLVDVLSPKQFIMCILCIQHCFW